MEENKEVKLKKIRIAISVIIIIIVFIICFKILSKKEKQVVGDNRNNDFQGFVLDDSPKTVEEQLEIIKKYLERSMPRSENE